MSSPVSKRLKNSKPLLEPLEPRVLYSADPFGLGAISDQPDDQLESASSIINPGMTSDLPSEVIFVDQTISGYQQLIDEIKRDKAGQTVLIHTISANESIEDITELLASYSNLSRIHFVTHGTDANIKVGSSIISNDSIESIRADLETWGTALNAEGDIFFYGCNLAATQDGKDLIREITDATGADIAASTDLTGHHSLGANWELEYVLGDVLNGDSLLNEGPGEWESILAMILVDTTDDEVNAPDLSSIAKLLEDPGPDGISLREAIIAANQDEALDVIVLLAGTYTLDMNPGPLYSGDEFIGDLDIHNSIYLQGSDIGITTIDAGKIDRVMSFTGGTSTIEHITIQNGETAEFGGGILVKDTTLTLDNVDLNNNTSTLERGGGIYIDGATVTLNITDSIIRTNVAGRDLPGLDSGGAIHNWQATVNLNRTQIFENEGSYGGAIFNHGALNLKDTWLHNNRAEVQGGAIYNDGNTTISRSLLEANRADYGGGLSNSGTTVVHDSTFSTNRADDSGGAIHNSTGTTDIYRTTIAYNRADNYAVIDSIGGTVNIQGSIVDNSDTASGADIHTNVNSLGHNLFDTLLTTPVSTDIIGTNPKIQNSLSDEGGFTKVYKLEPNSPAINGGAAIDKNASTSDVDATGATRNNLADIGAYEYRHTESRGELFWAAPLSNEIYRGSTDGKNNKAIISALEHTPIDIEVDTLNNRIYWLESEGGPIDDGGYGKLFSAKLDGSDITPVAIDLHHPTGLALDVENNRLFVTHDSTSSNDGTGINAIDEYTLNGIKSIAPVARGNEISDTPPTKMIAPSDVEYDPVNRNLIWTDRNSGNSGIQAVDEFGNMSTILSTTADPNGLSITPDGNSIYWVDNAGRVIHSNVSNGLQQDASNSAGILVWALEHYAPTDTVYVTNTNPFNPSIVALSDTDLKAASILYDFNVLPTAPGGITVASLSSVHEGPSVEINTGVTVIDDDTIDITQSHLNSIDPNSNAEDLIYTVASFPQHGKLLISGVERTAANPNFSQSDINAGILQYSHSGSQMTTDNFNFTVSDGGENSAEKMFDISVTLLNDAPSIETLESTALNYTENTDPVNISNAVTLTDPDDTNLESVTITLDNGYQADEDILHYPSGGSFSSDWNASAGRLTLTASDTIEYFQTAIRSVTYQNTSEDPNLAPRNVSIVLSDGDDVSVAQSRLINITSTNDAPTLASAEASPLLYTEATGSQPITAALDVSDIEGDTITSAVIQITTGFNNTEDELAFTNAGAISGTWVSSSGTLTLNGEDTIANYRTALRSVTYENTSLNPDVTSREVSFTVKDGLLDSNSLSRSIDITPVNTNPDLTITGTLNYTENDSPTLIAPTAMVSDPDLPANFDLGQLQISFASGASISDRLTIETIGNGPGEVNFSNGDIFYEGTLHATSSGGTDGSTPLVITLNGNSSTQSVQAILRSVLYENVSNTPAATVEYTVELTDGDGGSVSIDQNISITANNDAPAITHLDGKSIDVVNNGTEYIIDVEALSTIVDPDGTNEFDNGSLVVSGTGFTTNDSLGLDTHGVVTLTAGFVNTSKVMVSGVPIGILSNVSASGMFLEFGTDATADRIDRVIHSLLFSSTDENLGVRTIELTLNDGDGIADGGNDSSTISVNIYLSDSSVGIISTDEDSEYTITAKTFNFTGITGNRLESITITTLPDTGTLKNGITDILLNDTITKDEIDNGNLKFVADSNDSGTPYTTFEFYVNSGNNTVNILSGKHSYHTLHNHFLQADYHHDAAAILGDSDNFGPSGISSTDISIQNSTDTIDSNYLSAGKVLFSGYVPDSAINASELAALDTWVQNGGILISSGDLDSHDTINSHFGLVTENGGSYHWYVTNTSHQIMNGKFGLVGDAGDIFQGLGNGGGYSESSLSVDDLVLARDSITNQATVVLRAHGSGFILFTADEGIFRSNMTGDGVIATPNDILTANVYAWAVENATPSLLHTMSIDVTPVNDEPLITSVESTALSYAEDSVPILVSPGLTVGDIDSSTLASATVNISSGYVANQDVLTFTSVGTITGDWDQATGTLSLSGTESLASYQTALRSVSYENSSDHPDTTTRTLSYSVFDGALDSKPQTRDVAVNRINDAPVLDNTGILIFDSIDEDSTSPAGNTVEQLFVSQGTSFISDADTGDTTRIAVVATTTTNGTWQFRLDGMASWIDVDLVSDSHALLLDTDSLLRFLPNHDYFGSTPSIEFRAVDQTSTLPAGNYISTAVNGGTSSYSANTESAAITVNAVNDNPVIDLVELGSLGYAENDDAIFLTSTMVVGDVDSENLQSATIRISNGYVESEDRLSFAGTGLTATWDAANGELTLSGDKSLAFYQAAFRSVTYENLSDNPDTSDRTMSFSVSDGTLRSQTLERTVSITASNDVPYLSSLETDALSYQENSPALQVTNSVVAGDVDNTILKKAVVQITQGYKDSQDLLELPNSGPIAGDWNNVNGTLTLSGGASITAYEAALRSVTYRNTSDDPDTTPRTLTFTLHDNGSSEPVSRALQIISSNDTPTIDSVEGSSLAYTENTGSQTVTSTIELADPDNTQITGAVVRISSGYQETEDTLAYTGPASLAVNWDASTGTLTLNGSATVADYRDALRAVTYTNSSDSPVTSIRTIEFTVEDDSDRSQSATRNITVTSVNDAPGFASSTDAVLDPIDEDTTNPPGDSVDNLLSDHYTDADLNSQLSGIAIVGNTTATTNGKWQYSTDGTDWHDVGMPVDSSALLLDTTTTLRFLPAANYFGTPDPLSLRLIDDSYTGSFTTGVSRVESSVEINGGSTSISSDTKSLITDVRTVNDPPSINDAQLSQFEDLPTESSHTVASIFQAGYSDIDGSGILAGIAITGNTVSDAGEWQYSTDSSNWYDVGATSEANSLSLAHDSLLRFVSSDDYNGTPPDLIVRAIDNSFSGNFTDGDARETLDTTVSATSGVSYSTGENRLRVTVESVNDAPVAANNTIYITEDTAYYFDQSDFGFSDDADGNSLSEVRYSTVSTGNLSGTIETGIVYIPEDDDDSPAGHSFSFTVVDDGGTDRGGRDTSANTYTINLSMLPVNDAPTGTSSTITISEDQRYSIQPEDFGFSDQAELHEFDHLIIDSLSPTELFSLHNNPVATGTVIKVSDLINGSLQFTPATDENGTDYATIGFRVADNGRTENGGEDTDPNTKTLTFDVTPVNDPPEGQNTLITAIEDQTYQFHSSDFGFSDSSDNHNLLSVKVTAIPHEGSLTLDGVTISNDTVVTATSINEGLLLYNPPLNSSGEGFAQIEFRVIDDGGAGSGGNDTSIDTSKLTINVLPVNDPPSGTDAVVTVIEDTPYTLTSAVFGYRDADADQELAAVIITNIPTQGVLTLSGQPVQDNQTIDAEDIDLANLIFRPNSNQFGDNYAVIEFQVVDSSNAENGNRIDATPATLTINVFPVNDSPDAVVLSDYSVPENSVAAPIGTVNVVDQDPADEHTTTVDDDRFEIVDGTLKLRDDKFLDFETESEVSIQVIAVDSDGGFLEQAITLVVQDVNDPPLIDKAITTQAGQAPYSFTIPIETFFDADGDTLTFSAAQADGSALPDWLSFDSATRTFTISPSDPSLSFEDTIANATASISVTTTDPEGETATVTFDITREPVFASAKPRILVGTPSPETETKADGLPNDQAESSGKEASLDTDPEELLADLTFKADAKEQAPPPPVIADSAPASTDSMELPTSSYLTTRIRPETETSGLQFADLSSSGNSRETESVIVNQTFSNLANQMNETTEAIGARSEFNTRLLGSTVTLSSGLSVGYILWLVRGGTLVASMLTSLPAWRFIDPLPVLDSLQDGADGEDTETLESMVEDNDEPQMETDNVENREDYLHQPNKAA